MIRWHQKGLSLQGCWLARMENICFLSNEVPFPRMSPRCSSNSFETSKELLLFRERPHVYADITPVSPVRRFCESRPFQPRLFSKKPSSNAAPKQECPPNPNTTSQPQVPPILTPDPQPHASNPKCQTPNPNTPTYNFQTPSPD